MNQKRVDVDVQVDLKEQSWIRTYWRPMMAWQYFIVCICDFIIFPLVAFWLAHKQGAAWSWDPLTLKDGGFYHMAMGIVIGVAAWQRGQENLLRTRIFGPELVSSYQQPTEHERMYIDSDDDGDECIDPPAHPTPTSTRRLK